MSAQAARRLLFYAFTISLLVHVVFVVVVHPPLPNDATLITVRIARHLTHITEETPRPSPPPTPAPKPRSIVHKPAPSIAHVPIVATHTAGPVPAATGGGAVAVTGPPGLPTPMPTSTPTPRPCNIPAAITATPDPPEIPPAARVAMTNGTARILVHLDATGAVLETSVSASSGNAALDQVAIAMARSATYLPPRAQCKPTAGDYTFSARFAAW